MTKIRLMSDLHLEFANAGFDLEPAGEDVLLLAGDIGTRRKGGEWAIKQAERLQVPVVMIPGNHELYEGDKSRGDMLHVYKDLWHLAAKSGGKLTFLQNAAAIVAGVRFVGATLWTDFNLNGDQALAMARAQAGMNDYYRIRRVKDGYFSPEHALTEHKKSRQFIEFELQHDFREDGVQTAVVTHHGPSERSIAGRYADSQINSAYVSNLEPLVESSNAALWVHGHVHHSFDYMIGGTRVITNPRGYHGYETNPMFNPNLIVEI